MKTRYVLLGLLTEGPQTGYILKKLIDLRFKYFWNESYGQIYPELKKMLLEGWVDKHSSDQAKRTQISYSITEKGYEALKIWLQKPPETELYRLEILIKVYFSSHVDADCMIQHLTTFQKNHRDELDILEKFQEELLRIEDPFENHEDVLSVIDFGIKSNHAYLAWCQKLIERYRKEGTVK